MEFLLAMSILTSAAGGSLERANAQQWMRASVTRDDGKKAANAEQGRPPQQQQNEAQAQVKKPREEKLRGGLCFALEFDGLNCFETIVSH